MIVSVAFAFQVRSSQGRVKLETEQARQTSRHAQVKQLKSEKLSPCLSGNLKDSNTCAYTTLSWPLPTSKVLFLETPKTSTLLILFLEINNFLQNRQWGLCSISRCFQMEQNTTHFPLIFPHVKLIGRKRSYWQMIGRKITRGRNSSLKCLSTGSLPTPFPRYFFPKQRACSQASSPPTRRDLTMLFSILFVSLSLKSPIRRNNN